MNDNATAAISLFEKAENFGTSSLELIRLRAIDRFAKAITSLTTKVVIGFTVALFFIFLNIGCALWIGDLTGNNFYGFFIMAGVILLESIFLYLFRAILIQIPVSNSVINGLLNQTGK